MTQLTIDTFLDFTAQELNVPIHNLYEQIAFKNIPTWSSLNALLYLARIHNETGVLLSSTELSELNTLRDLFDQIISKQHGV
jgi:acyl carrier protein